MRLLVVEDQPKVANFIKKGLEEASYAVDTVKTGEEALDYAQTLSYDLILLDLMIPKKDGFEVCRSLRAQGIQTPILMLTARDLTEDKVKGLDAGADDYLTKPFSFSELLARVRALLRRGGNAAPATLELEDLRCDLVKHEVTRAAKPIVLTQKEFSLLEYLLRNKGLVVTRTMIAEHVWDLHFDTETNLIDVYITRLRKKIDEPFDIKLIHTIRGRGYVLKEENV